MFKANENRIGALAGMVALVLVLALTVMAFTALSPQPGDRQASWDASMPDPQTTVIPSFGS